MPNVKKTIIALQFLFWSMIKNLLNSDLSREICVNELLRQNWRQILLFLIFLFWSKKIGGGRSARLEVETGPQPEFPISEVRSGLFRGLDFSAPGPFPDSVGPPKIRIRGPSIRSGGILDPVRGNHKIRIPGRVSNPGVFRIQSGVFTKSGVRV